jgi:hypothetical protein
VRASILDGHASSRLEDREIEMRNLRLAGVAMAACALIAFVASPASAAYDSEVEVTTLSGSQTGEIALATDVGTLKCSAVTFLGTQTGSFKEAGVWTSKTARVHGTYGGIGASCKLGTQAVTVTTTGCHYEVAEAIWQEATTSIVCETGKSIVVKDTSGLGCEVKAGAQTPSGHVTFTNSGAGEGRSISWKLEVAGISYSWTAGCPEAKGKAGSNTNGAYTGSLSLKGFKPGGEQVGIWATRTGPPTYDSEVETTTLVGSQGVSNELVTTIGTVKCTTAASLGTQTGALNVTGSFSSEKVTVHPTFSGCTLAGIKVTVATNGCNYEVAEAKEFKASTSIACEAGKEIVVKDTGGAGCELKVAPQAPSGQLAFANVGAGAERHVTWSSELTGIASSWTAGCPNTGGKAGSDAKATFKGTTTFKGFNPEGEQVGIWVTS